MPDVQMIKISELTEASEYLSDDYTIIDNGVTSRKIKADKIGGAVDMGEIIDTIYPVGSIYLSIVSTNPSQLFLGTTWVALQDRFLIGAGNSYNVGTVGGEASVTLTANQMPSHYHSVSYNRSDGAGGGSWLYLDNNTPYNNSKDTDSKGGGQAHNNMPPYLAVYMWKRTA